MPHILVIEDDLAFREPLVKLLTNDGHQVTVADDGEEGLTLLKAIRPDLLITDILMPKMDGIEVILELSRSGNVIPIIAMSGGRRSLTRDADLASVEVLGVRMTLEKPFSRAELRRAIEQALAGPTPGLRQ